MYNGNNGSDRMNRRKFLKLAAGAVAGAAAAVLKPVGQFLPRQQEEIPVTLGNGSLMLVDYTAGGISAGDVRRRIEVLENTEPTGGYLVPSEFQAYLLDGLNRGDREAQ